MNRIAALWRTTTVRLTAIFVLIFVVFSVSLLAFMVTLPVAFLSLVPAGAVGGGVFDLVRIVTAIFPFKPALQAMTAALDSAGPGIGMPLLHLAILIAAYGLLARLALRRFAAV